MMGRTARGLAAVVIAGGLAGTVGAFQISGDSWPGPEIVMELQLGPSSGALIDGSLNWGQSVEGAMATWNAVIGGSQFRVVRDSAVPIFFRNEFNNVYFDNRVDGRSFTGAVAITIFRTRGSDIVEADVVFNSDLDYNSYRGPLKRSEGGGTLYDIRRVALHELGHVLGLDHPDQFGQNVAAVMNSRVSDVDNLLSDDIAGGQAIYGAAPVVGEMAGGGSVSEGGSSGGGGDEFEEPGELGRVLRPERRSSETSNRRLRVRGIADRAEGARRVILENNRFQSRRFQASGVTRWRATVDLRRGVNRIRVFVKKPGGLRERVRSLVVRRRAR